MQLRWFQTYNKNGLDSQKELQYWDEDVDRWDAVDFVRVKESEEECEMTRKPWQLGD